MAVKLIVTVAQACQHHILKQTAEPEAPQAKQKEVNVTDKTNWTGGGATVDSKSKENSRISLRVVEGLGLARPNERVPAERKRRPRP